MEKFQEISVHQQPILVLRALSRQSTDFVVGETYIQPQECWFEWCHTQNTYIIYTMIPSFFISSCKNCSSKHLGLEWQFKKCLIWPTIPFSNTLEESSMLSSSSSRSKNYANYGTVMVSSSLRIYLATLSADASSIMGSNALIASLTSRIPRWGCSLSNYILARTSFLDICNILIYSIHNHESLGTSYSR